MGIYDREYYRDERSSFLGTLAGGGQVWKQLILFNVVVFIVQLATADKGVNGWFTRWLALDADAVLHGQVWRLLTGAFLHSFDIWHIAINMLILWWAGSEVEGIYGPKEFLAFYLSAAVLSSSAFVASEALTHAAGQRHSALGASGAVAAVLMLFALHFPRRIVYLIFFPVPVLVLVILFVAQDALGLLGGAPGVAFAAHLGGAAFGFLYYRFHWRILNLWPTGWQWRWRPGRVRPRLTVYRGEPESEPVPVASERPPAASDSQLEAELDAVLEKVARHGKSSLTEREHQVLLRASEIYRNRRK